MIKERVFKVNLNHQIAYLYFLEDQPKALIKSLLLPDTDWSDIWGSFLSGALSDPVPFECQNYSKQELEVSTNG